MAENKPGRPREYASDADRVRAWRARQKDSAAAFAGMETPTDPAEAAATLAQLLPLLRQEAETVMATFSALADRITGSVDILADPAAIDAHLRRAQVATDKAKADAAAEIEQLRGELDAALDDRANADAAASAAEAAAEVSAAALAAAGREHDEHVRTLELAHRDDLAALAAEHAATLDRWQHERDTADAGHRDALAEQHRLVESLRGRTTALEDEITAVRREFDRNAATSAATISRLESDLDEARTATHAERARADTARDDLATANAELATAQAHAAAARERAEELRADLTAARRTITPNE